MPNLCKGEKRFLTYYTRNLPRLLHGHNGKMGYVITQVDPRMPSKSFKILLAIEWKFDISPMLQ